MIKVGVRKSQAKATPSNNEAVRRSTRKINAPIKYNDNGLMTQVMSVDEPKIFDEAKNHEEWMNAMHQEYISIINNKTWELIELSTSKFPIGCKWLFKIEFNVDGIVDKFKARLVAKGYSQKEGIDYEDTFALVAKMNTIRLTTSLATKFYWVLHQMDVKLAFLNGDLREEIYLIQPKGFVK